MGPLADSGDQKPESLYSHKYCSASMATELLQ